MSIAIPFLVQLILQDPSTSLSKGKKPGRTQIIPLITEETTPENASDTTHPDILHMAFALATSDKLLSALKHIQEQGSAAGAIITQTKDVGDTSSLGMRDSLGGASSDGDQSDGNIEEYVRGARVTLANQELALQRIRNLSRYIEMKGPMPHIKKLNMKL